MPTYAEIRKFVCLALDVDPATQNDFTVDLIDFHIQRVVQDIIVRVRPKEVLMESTVVTVNDATTVVPFSSFATTDFAAIHGITVDTEIADTGIRSDIFWSPVEWVNWVGHRRSEQCGLWTYDPDKNFYLSDWPDTGKTWEVRLHYYRLPEAISDAGIPEIPVEHHLSTIVPGVIMAFPHRFIGSRQELLAYYTAMFTGGMNSLMSRRNVRTHQRFFRPKGTSQPDSNVNIFPDWPTGP